MSDDTRKTGPTHQQPRSRGHGSVADSRSIHPSMAGDFYRDTNAVSQKGSYSQFPAAASQSQMSQYGAPGFPQLPFMPFGGGPGSTAGSEYGGLHAGMPQLPYQNAGSVYGMMPNAPRNTVMTNMNMFGGDGITPQFTGAGGTRPMSTFSMATSVNPFAGPSMNPDPTDDDLFNALRNYLSTQDLMTVTKK